MHAYRPICGPTLLLSKDELAVMSSSFISPLSMPNGAIHCAEKRESTFIQKFTLEFTAE